MSPNTSSARGATIVPLHGASRRSEKVAVLLNANARRVNEAVRHEIARYIPADDVYYSRSMDEARAIVSEVLDKGYTTLLTGGGDGTFVGAVNEVLRQLDEAPVAVIPDGNTARKVITRRPTLRFGTLHLGTGNSLAGHYGASSSRVGIIEDILRARSGDVSRTQHLHLIEVEGRRAPFTGVGTDAKILNDYVKVKTAFENLPFSGLASGATGYFMSVTGLSIPSIFMQGKAPNAEIINEGPPVQQLGPDGRPVGRPIGTGAVIYSGPCRFAAVGTVSGYGFGFTMFPHATRYPGKMQLRLTAMSAGELLRHIPAIWKGRTPTASILDFAVEKVRVSFDRPMPFQIGGDAEGTRDKIAWAIDKQPIEMLDFRSHG